MFEYYQDGIQVYTLIARVLSYCVFKRERLPVVLFISGVNDTADKFTTGVVDAGDKLMTD